MRITFGAVMVLLVACDGNSDQDAGVRDTLTVIGEGRVSLFTQSAEELKRAECPGQCTSSFEGADNMVLHVGVSAAPGWYLDDLRIDGVSIPPADQGKPVVLGAEATVTAVFVETNPAPDCSLPPSLGPVGTGVLHCLGRTFGDPTDAETILCDLDLDESDTPDVLVFELHDGNAGDPVPGTYDLAAQGDYASCLKCAVLFTDRVPPVPAQGDAWVASAGTMVIEQGEAGGHMRAHLDNLVLDHVTIQPDFSTPPAADGCSTEIWSAYFDADIDYQPGVR